MADIKICMLSWKDTFETYKGEFRDEFKGVRIDTLGCNFSYEEVVNNAKKMEQTGYDAIIARGYSAGLFKDLVNIPTIIAEPDMTDLIRAILDKGIQPGEKASIILYRENPLLKYEELRQHLKAIFGIDVIIYQYSDMNQYLGIAEKALKQREFILTGYRGNELSRMIPGSRAGGLYVGLYALRNACIEAIRIVEIRRKEIHEKSHLEAILESSAEALININENKQIVLMNNAARKALEIPQGRNVNGEFITDYIDVTDWDSLMRANTNDLIATLLSCPQKVIMNSSVINDPGYNLSIIISFRLVEKIVEAEKRIRADLYRKGQVAKYSLGDIKGECIEIIKCKSDTKKYADSGDNVLIYGETGTGKELFAQSIHNESPRREEPFYAINCAAMPENLLESELFGYTEGSFTGAKRGGKAGIFEMAHRGTVYLDEIGELPLAFQSSLLRVLQEKEIRRIGDDRIVPVDVRIISASHRDIYSEVVNKRFREDLFYRLNVVYLTIPSLRERGSDILLLLDHFIRKYSEEYKRDGKAEFTKDAEEFLMKYSWPGNIRELQNFVRRLFTIGCESDRIDVDNVMKLLRNSVVNDSLNGNRNNIDEKGIVPLTRTKISAAEIEEVISICNGNKTEAAKLLKISRTHLWRLMNNK